MTTQDAPPAGFFTRAARAYVQLIRFISGALLAVILVIMVAQITLRYGFNASLIWAEELSRYLLVWLTFVAIGLSYQEGHLTGVDTVTEALPARLSFMLKLLASIPLVVFLGLMTYFGYMFAARLQAQTIPAFDFIWSSIVGKETPVRVSIFWLYICVSVGCMLLIGHVVIAILLDFRRAFLGGAPPPRAAAPGGGTLA